MMNSMTTKSKGVMQIAIAFCTLLLIYPATAYPNANLLANPGFENGTEVPLNWTFVTYNESTPVWDNVSHSGENSIRISVNGMSDNISGHPISDMIPAEPFQNYNFSAWGKTEGTGGTNAPVVRIVEIDSNNSWVRQINLPDYENDTNEWTQKSIDFQTSFNTSYLYIYANIWNGYGNFWVDDVSLSFINASENTSIQTVQSISRSNSVPISTESSKFTAESITSKSAPVSVQTMVFSPDSKTTASSIVSNPAPVPVSTPVPAPVSAPIPASSGNTYYVSKSGNDNNPGTKEKPWLTITKAANTLAAGDTVYVREGTYKEQVTVKNSGSAGKYIAFSAYPGDSVTLDGSGLNMADWSGLFWINGKDYIKVIGFNLINGRTGVHAESASNIVIKDNYIENPYHCGIKVGWGDSSDILIENNEVKRNIPYESNEMISISNGKNIEVRNNHVLENVNGIGIDMKDGTSDSLIHHNIVEGISAVGIYVDGYADGVSNIDVYDNTAFDTNTGFSAGSERGGLTQNIKFHDNVAHDNVVGYAAVDWGEPGFTVNYKDVYFTNNDAYSNSWLDYWITANNIVVQKNT